MASTAVMKTTAKSMLSVILLTLSCSVLCNTENVTIFLEIDPNLLEIEVGNEKSFEVYYDNHNVTVNPINIVLNETRTDIVHLKESSFSLNDTKYSVVAKALNAGHVIIKSYVTSQNISVNTDNANISISVFKSLALNIFSIIIGWIYFFSWTFSFYPQIWDNYKRKSVIGLNFDYLILNFVGHSCYNMFNVGLYWIPLIQTQYFEKFPFGHIIPVQTNDVAFSMHAVFATVVTLIQVCIYEKGSQRVSYTCIAILSVIGVFLGISAVLSAVNVISWLDYLYYISYVKLFITIIKCCPQAYLNYKRQSTVGWSIGNVLMDFVGGALSILQMFVIAANYNDWSTIFGDFTKFGLGALSIFFDVLFMVQHYVLYKESKENINLIDDETSTQSYVNNVNKES